MRRHRHIDQPERQLGGLADDVDELLRIAETGHLHQDTVGALALDRRLDQAELVDAPLDDLDRLIHHLADPLDDGRLHDGELNEPATGVDDIERALAGRTEEAAKRLRQFAELGQRLVQVVFAHAHFDGVAANDRRAHQADARVARRLADFIAQRVDLLLAHVVDVDFEQDMRSTLQIEPQHNVALRPFRPLRDGRFGKEVRDRAQANHQRGEQNRGHLPL